MNMKAKPRLEQSMQEEQIRTALNMHWHASTVGDANAEHDIYDDDATCDYYPQSGERILGRSSLQALRSHNPASRPASKSSGFWEAGIPGSPNTQSRTRGDWVMEFGNGRVVHETQYFGDPFEAPAWRRQWVQQIT